MQFRPSNDGVVFLGIRSLLPALAESESVALTGVQPREQQAGPSAQLSVAPTRGEF